MQDRLQPLVTTGQDAWTRQGAAGAPSLPATLGRYRIDGELGRGTCGTVYLAWDPNLQRTLVLKTMASAHRPGVEQGEDSDRLLARFAREGRAAARLAHRAVVIVHDMGHDEALGIHYIAMEHVAGVSLHAKLKQPLSLAEIGDILMPVAEALDAAHALGIIHRDVKPANILIGDDGTVKLADFGVAHLDDSELTRAGTLIGSPCYMAPELISGGALTGAVDEFALAVVLYQLVTGRMPFDGAGMLAVFQQTLTAVPTPAWALVGVAAELSDVIGRGLAKNPLSRFESCVALVAGFRDAAAGDPTFRRQEVAKPSPTPAPRRKHLIDSDDFLEPAGSDWLPSGSFTSTTSGDPSHP